MMLKMSHQKMEEPISIHNLTMLSIAHPLLFRQIVSECSRYDGNGDIKLFLDIDFKSLKATDVITITDILGYELNTTATLKTIYSTIEKRLNQNHETIVEIEELLEELSEQVSKELLEYELELFVDDFSIPVLLKALLVKLNITENEILDKIYQIIEVFRHFQKAKILIFINLSTYLSESDIIGVEEYCKLSGADVLMIESGDKKLIENSYYLDEDMVLVK